MAIPRVFVSSTCYDLRYIRENLKFFIKNMGFEPILSEEGSVYYDPNLNVQDACLAEIPNCQLFVLIIGGRAGSHFKNLKESIVNYEYRKAIKMKVPVFAMVEQQVHSEYKVYLKNKENEHVDCEKIKYPGVDSTKIFHFMSEVESKSVNNALVPFSNFNGLESYLKKQWAGLMFSFLTTKSESERVADMLETLTTMSNRIEFLSKQILSSVGKDLEKINALLYEIMSGAKILGFRKIFEELDMKPIDFIKNDNLEKFLGAVGIKVKIEGPIVHFSGTLGADPKIVHSAKQFFSELTSDYAEKRKKMTDVLSENNLGEQEFIAAIEQRNTMPKKE
jgi:hypothetical protein